MILRNINQSYRKLIKYQLYRIKYTTSTTSKEVNINNRVSFRGPNNKKYPSMLYDPKYEKDSCGVGLIANLNQINSRDIVINANRMLVRMAHRGGCGCDPSSGDGAGMLVGIPHEFMNHVYKNEINKNGSVLNKGNYAVGNIFFNYNDKLNGNIQKSKLLIEEICDNCEFKVLGWRTVPTDSSSLGESSKLSEPYIEQIFIENSKCKNSEDFERELLRIRTLSTKENQRIITESPNNKGGDFYICSLSSRTITYKGQLTSEQLYSYYKDLQNPLFSTYVALVHSRFSTNTFPSWDRAQPNRVMCHNGEINTLRGNKNWMYGRESDCYSRYFGNVKTLDLFPVCSDDMSDSGNFDSVLELISKTSYRSLPEAMSMMIPEAWQNDRYMEKDKKFMYEYHSCLMEPWDGPAMMAFTDGKYFGATLDRNGLRPSRYYVTKDSHVILSSEIGVLPDLKHSDIISKSRLEPGKMFLIDFEKKKIIADNEVKTSLANRRPFKTWITDNLLSLSELSKSHKNNKNISESNNYSKNKKIFYQTLNRRLNMFGYTTETLDMILFPMALTGKEPLGSMGNDAPLAILSDQPKLPYEYFKQLFAQVTNPPIDPIREELVMSLSCTVGPQLNLLDSSPKHARKIIVDNPILSYDEMETFKYIDEHADGFSSAILDATFLRNASTSSLTEAIETLCEQAINCITMEKKNIIIISDALAGRDRLPIPSLLALGAVHQHLVKTKQRTKVALFVESGDAKEIHDFCTLIGFGCDGVYPHMAYDAIDKLEYDGTFSAKYGKSISRSVLQENYRQACALGIKKVMSKMGISTLHSYKGAQVFEAVGLAKDVMDLCFTGTASRLQGVNFSVLATDIIKLHEAGYPLHSNLVPLLRSPGNYHYRDSGELHYNSPENMVLLQTSTRLNSHEEFQKYCEVTDELSSKITLRGLLKFVSDRKPIPINQVEPVSSIMKRFNTGAMSLGSISQEAHETLAVAMNKIGGRSNTGEGGEDPLRYIDKTKRSAIKQVASGRFGVTIEYLSNADQIQIKMAQGAKPGEGGELPGHKVSQYIGSLRHTTPGVGLISPPPHHDIYSIEDLAQLIYDLKCSNPSAEISVKLVSEVGVGVVAAGVAKAYANHITISGHDGGTGASSWTGVKNGGLPWELGLAEAQQTLVLNNLRSRVRLQTDGQLKTPKDVVIAACLGAEEFGFSTSPLVTLGCIMMRKCHLNTCPVGIATQDEELRKKFTGKPEHVINFFYLLAEEIRLILASLGINSMNEIIGRTDLLTVNTPKLNYKTSGLDFSPILLNASVLNENAETRNTSTGSVIIQKGKEEMLDEKIIKLADNTFNDINKKCQLQLNIENVHRSVGARLSHELVKKFGPRGIPDETIHIKFLGSAGQSFGFCAIKGLYLELEGDANDYVGKSLSGGKIAIYPSKLSDGSIFRSHENVIIGNAVLYGATSGEAYFSGVAGERFAVRNSGATAVVEGVGAHGCEYMTGGIVLVLGHVGRNFAAGMSGGIAYIFDQSNLLERNCNKGMVNIKQKLKDEDTLEILSLLKRHYQHTNSERAKSILSNYDEYSKYFKKVISPAYEDILNQKEELLRSSDSQLP